MTITKALLNVIADAKTKVYGDADPSLTYQVSGLKNLVDAVHADILASHAAQAATVEHRASGITVLQAAD